VTWQQWRSRTFGRLVRWSNLSPYCLRFWKVEPDAVEDPIKPTIALVVRLCLYFTRKFMKLTIWNFTWFFLQFSPICRPPLPSNLASAAWCGPHPSRYASAWQKIGRTVRMADHVTTLVPVHRSSSRVRFVNNSKAFTRWQSQFQRRMKYLLF